ncbi:dTDP-4-dehydrorhamnose 3,5-epimerase [Thermococci archaeon]|nr:MAG: dTDP-4-dehydrorhamnose 3,5-epimerase [Thermococci archaeon]
MRFEFKRLEIPDVILIKPKVFEDERGFFMETYRKEEFEKAGIKEEFVQDGHSRSKYGVLRGLHFQKEPYAHAKLVRCTKGIIYDVVVDLRRDSPTFGKYASVILSEFNKYILYVPKGFAHGFVVLSEEADVLYKFDKPYNPEYYRGLVWNDPDVNIKWPIDNPIVSLQDQKWPTLKELIKYEDCNNRGEGDLI